MSVACHLVAVTLLAGREPAAVAAAPLDGAIHIDAEITDDAFHDFESQPAVTRQASRARPPLRLARPIDMRLRPARHARVAKTATPATIDRPVPVALTGSQPGNGVNPQAPPAQRAQPVQLPSGIARSLRIHDVFPRMPDLLRAQHRAETADLEICVSEKGSVSDLRIRGVSAPLEAALRAAVITWRYQPHLVDQTPTPFCHPLRLHYRS